MAIITLTTDFGTKDHFVAAIKGRILSEVPQTTIVDISHEISPFDIHECAYILGAVYHGEMFRNHIKTPIKLLQHFFVAVYLYFVSPSDNFKFREIFFE